MGVGRIVLMVDSGKGLVLLVYVRKGGLKYCLSGCLADLGGAYSPS